MDIMILLGFVTAFLSFYFGVPELREEFAVYFQPNAFLFVLGGTLASTMISTSLSEFRGLLRVFRQLLFRKRPLQPTDAVNKLVDISKKAQVMRKQDLVKEGAGVGDGFLERALGLVAAGLDRDFVQKTLETDIIEIRRRHTVVANIVRAMGTFAPMFGMAGTVLGVIQVLKNVTDIDTIVSGMSLALLTTLYGLVLSSVVFIPLTNKLKARSQREQLVKAIITEGVLEIMDKEIPLKVEQYLNAYIADKAAKAGNTDA